MRAVLGGFLGYVLGSFLAGITVAAFLRVTKPRDTEIRCAYCGQPVPMAVADRDGVGGVNRFMAEHVAGCPLRPRFGDEPGPVRAARAAP